MADTLKPVIREKKSFSKENSYLSFSERLKTLLKASVEKCHFKNGFQYLKSLVLGLFGRLRLRRFSL
jgi:hypothetical protein